MRLRSGRRPGPAGGGELTALPRHHGALQGGPRGKPWPTKNFGWVGRNAFGPTNNWPSLTLLPATGGGG